MFRRNKINNFTGTHSLFLSALSDPDFLMALYLKIYCSKIIDIYLCLHSITFMHIYNIFSVVTRNYNLKLVIYFI